MTVNSETCMATCRNSLMTLLDFRRWTTMTSILDCSLTASWTGRSTWTVYKKEQDVLLEEAGHLQHLLEAPSHALSAHCVQSSLLCSGLLRWGSGKKGPQEAGHNHLKSQHGVWHQPGVSGRSTGAENHVNAQNVSTFLKDFTLNVFGYRTLEFILARWTKSSVIEFSLLEEKNDND